MSRELVEELTELAIRFTPASEGYTPNSRPAGMHYLDFVEMCAQAWGIPFDVGEYIETKEQFGWPSRIEYLEEG